MSDSLGAQVSIAQSLLNSLNGIVENAKTSRNTFESQTEISNNLNQTLNTFTNSFGTMTTNFLDMSKKISKAFDSSALPDQASFSKEMEKGAQKARKSAEEATGTTQQISDSTKERTGLRNKQAKAAISREVHAKAYVETSKKFIILDAVFGSIQEKLDKATAAFNDLDIVKRAAMSNGMTLLLDIPKLLITGVFKVLSSIIGLYFNFFKLSISLPFMVAERAVQIGNAFREDIIVNIGNAYQATKEYSDANSNIGKGIQKMQNVAVGALKTFENPRSYMVQLFGEGAAGASAFLSEISKSIDDMGPVAEIIGPQVSNSRESAEFLLTAIRGLGLTAKETSYYALDSAVTQQNMFDRLEKVKKTVTLAANNHSVDTKQVSLGMQKLRSNIKDFGHLTDMNLANLVARMRQLNVGAEDLVSVFGKFTSFEDSAKTAAMLQQSFNMSIDALDMLTAKDPGEIVEKFRDAMFETGRDYEDLNRHEKQLMQTTTGMTDAMLKSLMTYQNMGLSYEEARQRVADNNPTKQQTEAIKGLTSSIKEIQKIMTFTSPFQAFMKGLGKNAAASDKVVKVSQSLSSLYETIYLYGLNLDKSTIEAITKPVIMIVNKVNEVFKSETFKSLLTTGTKTMSDVVSFVTKDFGVSNKEYSTMTKIINKINALDKSQNVNTKKDQASVRNKLQDLLKTADQSVLRHLKAKGVITEDKKLVKNIATQAILNELRSATQHIETREGKQSLSELSEKLREHTDQIITKHVFDKEFSKNYGIRGQIARTTEDFQKMFDQGGGLFMTIFKLGGKIMGAIIKGFALGFSALLLVMTGQIDNDYNNSSTLIGKHLSKITGQNPSPGKPFNVLTWLGITKKEKNELSESVVKGLRDLVSRYDKIFTLGAAATSMFTDAVKSMAGMILQAFAHLLTSISDPLVTAFLWYKLDEPEKNKLVALQTGGATTDNFATIAKTFKKNERKKVKKGEDGDLAIDGAYFIQLHSLFKKMYGKNTPYGKGFHGYRGPTDTDGLADFMAKAARVKQMERFLPYQEYLKYATSNPGKVKALDAALNKTFDFKKYFNGIPKWTKSSGKGTNLRKMNIVRFKESSPYADKAGFRKRLNHYIGSTINYVNNKAKAYDGNKPYTSKNIGKRLGIKDGFISDANSMFNDGALKLITASGQVIVPDSMDELASLSGKTQSGLIEVFSGAANAYQSASNLVNDYSTINSLDASDEASEELIGEMISLFYETLEIGTQIKKNDYAILEVNI
tara:strand:+ start:1002 stop:4748 length:3747 start_codon:yes stop_codon:yes gene_type:complete